MIAGDGVRSGNQPESGSKFAAAGGGNRVLREITGSPDMILARLNFETIRGRNLNKMKGIGPTIR